MGLSTFHNTPGTKHTVLINKDVLDIAQRLQEGDATCGWSGDPRLYVVFNYDRERYEVRRYCEDGRVRLINSWAPQEFDTRVLVHFAEHDTWHGQDPLARVEKEEDEKERNMNRNLQEIYEGMQDVVKRIDDYEG